MDIFSLFLIMKVIVCVSPRFFLSAAVSMIKNELLSSVFTASVAALLVSIEAMWLVSKSYRRSNMQK